MRNIVVTVLQNLYDFQQSQAYIFFIFLICPSVFSSDLLVESLVSVVLGSLSVDEVKTAGLELSVDEGSCETGEDLLGLCVACRLSILSAVLLVCLGGLLVIPLADDLGE